MLSYFIFLCFLIINWYIYVLFFLLVAIKRRPVKGGVFPADEMSLWGEEKSFYLKDKMLSSCQVRWKSHPPMQSPHTTGRGLITSLLGGDESPSSHLAWHHGGGHVGGVKASLLHLYRHRWDTVRVLLRSSAETEWYCFKVISLAIWFIFCIFD